MDRISAFFAVVSALPMPAVVIGNGRRILCMNAGAAALFGHDATGAHFTTVLRQPSPIAAIEAALAGQDVPEATHLLRDGTRDQRFQLAINPLGSTPSPGVLVVFEDVSRAEGLGQVRRDFVANVSHELRTPLTALMGFIETLQGPAASDAVARERFLSMAMEEAARMNRLVQDLLSLSRVESEERLRPDAAVRLAPLLGESAATVLHAQGDGGADITVEVPGAEVTVHGDRDQLMQVFRNLMENAVKYGGGQATVSLTTVDHDPALRGPAAIINVADRGEGIAAHHLPRLTERFYRIDAHRSRAQGGTGLGLAIVKHIVNRHRGRLRITSTPGEGSSFAVFLPLA